MSRLLGLVVVWLAASRSLTPGQVVAGVLVALLAVALVPPWRGPTLHWLRLPRLVLDEAVAVARSTFAVLRLILSPGTPEPAVVAVQLEGGGAREAAWVATLMTITPGTYVVDLAPDGSWISLHLVDRRQTDGLADAVQHLHRDVCAVTAGSRGRATAALPATPTSEEST